MVDASPPLPLIKHLSSGNPVLTVSAALPMFDGVPFAHASNSKVYSVLAARESFGRMRFRLDVVTEEQAVSHRVTQWLKRLFVLLRYSSSGSEPNATKSSESDNHNEPGIDLERTMHFVKEVILGPKLRARMSISSSLGTMEAEVEPP